MGKSVIIDEDKLNVLKQSEITEAAPEVDEYEIGAESDNPPVGGNGYHIDESASFDSSEIGAVMDINAIAKKIQTKGNSSYILTNGEVITFRDHNEISKINGMTVGKFLNLGNIRIGNLGGIELIKKPTKEQIKPLKKHIIEFNGSLFLDIASYKEGRFYAEMICGAEYKNANPNRIINDILAYFDEGIKPQGNRFYESKKNKTQIIENKYDDLFNKANYDLQYFLKQGKEKYGIDGWYISSWMKMAHPEISVDPKDIRIYTALSDKLHKITKLWNDENNKEENGKDLEQPKENYDIISLATEEFGLTSRLSQAGYILPDGKLLNFGNNCDRDTDHKAIEGIYKQNGIKIWNDEYRYNYVVDFMNHGAIRCDVNSGILDMTKEPTNEQFYTIKDFVREAVDVDIDFTDDKGNTLHSVSYSDAKPQAVVADIMRYYEDGIKPMGNVQYENKNMNNSHLIIESQESKSIAAAKKLVMQRLNYNEQEADEFIRIKLRNDIPMLRTPQGGKFILGVTRMFCDGELRTANDIGNLNSTLKLVASDAHINEYDRNLNGMSCQELVQRFSKAMSDNLEAEKAEIGKMVFNTPSDYEIVRIDSFEQAEEYGDYVSWCVTHDENMFDSYTSDGINQFYFCLRNGFENVEEVPSEGCPLDEYGLSMIAVSVNENGMLNTCTCRWNHDNGGDDSIMNAKEVSQVIGMNFFDVFKPNNKWKDLLTNAIQRLGNGEDPRTIFDSVDYFREGFARVNLNDKYNFINQEGRFLSDQWFDYVGDFKEGFAVVELNGKRNFINQECKFLSNQWFDYGDEFSEGFGRVKLNGKWNYINQECKFLSNQWFEFDDVYNFNEGFAAVELNDKWNFINQKGKLLSGQWFDDASNFYGGFARVQLNDKYNYITQECKFLSDQWFDYADYFFSEGFGRVKLNGKWNFINQEGRFLSDQWFDYVGDFKEGFGRVKLNGNVYKLDTSGNLSLSESKNKNKKILIHENQLESIKENFDFEVDSSEIDLSSFKKKHELVPNIWKPDGKLDSRIRLKLLDIADDFWKYVNLTWVEPSGIILTGSICNFNWSQYSDIDLHLIVDFDEIDEKTEFVRDYLDAKKNEWNNEHSGLQIMGYQVELYVQNLGEMPESNGIYDLEENDWIKEPNPDDIKSIGLNKFSIKDKAAKIMTIIDDMYDALASTDDSYQIEEMGNDASYLWKKVKNMRKNSLEKEGESGSGNIVYKILRRTGYLDRLFKLSNVVYDKSNSITESVDEMQAWHGTDAVFDKFDLAFLSKGEGSQEYGKGIYVTSSKSTGEHYVEIIRDVRMTAKGTEYMQKKWNTSDDEKENAAQEYQNFLDNYDSIYDNLPGYLYKVDIPDDNGNNYFDYAAPMTPDEAKNIFIEFCKKGLIERGKYSDERYNKLVEKVNVAPYWNSIKSGRDFHLALYEEGMFERFSAIIESLGYIGIKVPIGYLHGMKYGRGKNNMNYVIFDPANVKIISRKDMLTKKTTKFNESNSITESKNKKKKYTVYIDGKKDDTFSDMNWKRKPKVGKGFYYGGAVFKIKKVTDDSIYAIEESKFNNKEIIKEYLEKDNNLPLYKYFKWASTASSCEKARDLAYSCSYYIKEYIEKIYYRYSEFEDLLNDDEFDYEDESLIEMFLNMLEENNLCDHFISIMRDIVDYYELPSWCTMDFNRIVKNEWCIHFGSDSESIAKEGFTGGTPEIEHLAYTNAGVQKSSAGYDFAFLINDRSVDYNGYGDEAVIFRTSGVEIYHYGDNQNQVIFWGPNVKSFIPIHQEDGDWVAYGQNGQVLVRCGRPSEIALWATENLPQYRKQIMTGKNGYTPKQWVYDKEQGRSKPIPYPIYRNESVKKYLTLLKENFINEEWVGDGNSEHNPYKKRWDAERKALKDFLSNYGKLMQSRENGKLYKCYYDKTLSQLIGYNYCICIQWDNINMKPKSVLYIRALDKFTPNIKQVNFDARGYDNVMGSYDDRRF